MVPWEDTYLFQEYGVTPEVWEQFRKRSEKRRAKEKYVSFDGPFDPKSLE